MILPHRKTHRAAEWEGWEKAYVGKGIYGKRHTWEKAYMVKGIPYIMKKTY